MTRNNNEDGKGGRATYEFLSPPPLSLVFTDRVEQTCTPCVGIYLRPPLPCPSGKLYCCRRERTRSLLHSRRVRSRKIPFVCAKDVFRKMLKYYCIFLIIRYIYTFLITLTCHESVIIVITKYSLQLKWHVRLFQSGKLCPRKRGKD